MCLSYTETKKTIHLRRLALWQDERVLEQSFYPPGDTDSVDFELLY
jgi:hypothetical protein